MLLDVHMSYVSLHPDENVIKDAKAAVSVSVEAALKPHSEVNVSVIARCY